MAHNANTVGDHDGRGRFAKGNTAGKGNPHHRRVAELRATMLERVTPAVLRSHGRWRRPVGGGAPMQRTER